jgi:hypothetical protein
MSGVPSLGTPTPDELRDLEVLIQAHHALLVIESPETERTAALLAHTADRIPMSLMVWQPGRGLRRVDETVGPVVHGTESPEQCLAFIEGADNATLYHLRGFASFLEQPEVAVRLKDIHSRYVRHPGAVVLTGPEVPLPPGLRPLFTPVTLAPPDAYAYHRLLSALLRDIRQRRRVDVTLTQEDVSRLMSHLQGLSLLEARKILTRLMVEEGRLSPDILPRVLEAKRAAVVQDGVLEYFPVDQGLSEVAGLTRLKAWMHQRAAVFAEPERARAFGLPAPKGLLLLGVQGCGKSLCAKAVAHAWGLPLVRLDPASMYQKYFGETEKNFRRATRAAEAMAPVVLWLDEIEKAFGGSDDNDSGTSRRVFGAFLTWMQEKDDQVFVIATANDVSQLPPELLRKGRFDEIFFVDLPDAEAREEIFAVHLRRRSRQPEEFDLGALAADTDGFSGAEIEQAVISGLYAAFAAGEELTTAHLRQEVAQTVPLSVTMRERVDALRTWARERTVPAG